MAGTLHKVARYILLPLSFLLFPFCSFGNWTLPRGATRSHYQVSTKSSVMILHRKKLPLLLTPALLSCQSLNQAGEGTSLQRCTDSSPAAQVSAQHITTICADPYPSPTSRVKHSETSKTPSITLSFSPTSQLPWTFNPQASLLPNASSLIADPEILSILPITACPSTVRTTTDYVDVVYFTVWTTVRPPLPTVMEAVTITVTSTMVVDEGDLKQTSPAGVADGTDGAAKQTVPWMAPVSTTSEAQTGTAAAKNTVLSISRRLVAVALWSCYMGCF